LTTLFEAQVPRPLADRLRPILIKDVVGQAHLLGATAPVGRMISGDRITSIILWGPPGTGKTTIARLLAKHTNYHFESLSAIFSGVSELRKVFEASRVRRESGRGTLLFVDEIHRFNKAQQDGFLPYVEDGTIILIGATTENPSYELNGALLSRCQVLILNRLGDDSLEELLVRAEKLDEICLPLSKGARATLRAMADGDGRYLLNMTEEVLSLPVEPILDTKALIELVQKSVPLYDKMQDQHYNLISALHKSLRGSDVDASLYWLARMLSGGEDPRYIARRLVRFASEDIGLADPNALLQAIASWDAFERIGSPEGELAIVQSVIYLATAPKSNAVYRAFKASVQLVKETGSLSPPKHILNASTNLMKDIGHGAGYQYDHDSDDGFSGQNYFPDGVRQQSLYRPDGKGFENEIVKRLDHWRKIRKEKGS
jgi:putative ATPase